MIVNLLFSNTLVCPTERPTHRILFSISPVVFSPQPVGRVKIQVYRGPSKGDYDFAPWGYYNTQPADLAIHH